MRPMTNSLRISVLATAMLALSSVAGAQSEDAPVSANQEITLNFRGATAPMYQGER